MAEVVVPSPTKDIQGMAWFPPLLAMGASTLGSPRSTTKTSAKILTTSCQAASMARSPIAGVVLQLVEIGEVIIPLAWRTSHVARIASIPPARVTIIGTIGVIPDAIHAP